MSNSEGKFECTVRAPREGEFFRVHPDPSYRKEEMMVDVDGVLYLVAENMVAEMERVAPGKMKKMMIFTAMNMEKETFLWPVEAPVPADHPAFHAIEHWISIGMPKELQIDASQLPNLIWSDPDTKH